MENEIPYNQLWHAFEILQELDGLRRTKQHCDFIIKVGAEEIHANRNVLCANSEYFKAMLAHDTTENQSGIVELQDLDPSCVIVCTDFMYGRKIEVTRDKWEPLILCADRLRLSKLCSCIEKYFVSVLDLDTFYQLWKIAKIYHLSDLEQTCDEFGSKNFSILSQRDEFCLLDTEELTFILSSETNKASQINKLKAVMKWTKFASDSRIASMKDILGGLSLSQIPFEYLRFLREKDELISSSFECSKLFTTAIMDSFKITALDACAFHNNANKILIFNDASRHLECWNPETNSSLEMHDLHPDMKDSFSALTLHNYLFVFMLNNEVLRLNLRNPDAMWEQMANMTAGHDYWPRVVSDSKSFYRIGTSSSFIEKYDMVSNCWERVADSNAPFGSSCVLLDRKIYCIGGYKNGHCDKSVEVFSLDTLEWNAAAPLFDRRAWVASCTCLGKIYVAGGQDNGKVVSLMECYDPSCDQWTSLPSLPVTRGVLPVVALGNRIYALGSYKCKEENILVQQYNVSEGKWTKNKGPVSKSLWIVGVDMEN